VLLVPAHTKSLDPLTSPQKYVYIQSQFTAYVLPNFALIGSGTSLSAAKLA
jgi:hypothetical protein